MKRIVMLSVCALIISVFAATAFASKKETPTTLDGGKVVDAETVKAMLGKPELHIFDMRKAINYGKGHLPGAISTPYKWVNKDKDPAKRTGTFKTSALPTDKDATLIFYSDGPTGWKSYYAAKWAIANGYKNVLYMRQGSAAWFEKGFPVE